MIVTSLWREIGFEPVHLEDIIPVNCEPSPKNDPENDPEADKDAVDAQILPVKENG